MNNLGLSMLEENSYAEAGEWFEQATRAAREIGDKDLLLTLLINTARAAAESGDLARARACSAEARKLAERMDGDPALADLACTLATIARIEKLWPQAEKWIAVALEASGEGRNPLAAADALEQRARLRIDQGRVDEAGGDIEFARAAYRILGASGAVTRLERLTSALPMRQP
jgi:tetratricopeptide (TPR) repeat protein